MPGLSWWKGVQTGDHVRFIVCTGVTGAAAIGASGLRRAGATPRPGGGRNYVRFIGTRRARRPGAAATGPPGPARARESMSGAS